MYIKREGCSLYYEVHGQGYPILFLHGNGEDHTYFKHQIQQFSDTYQVIVMDMRGHGCSDHGTQPLDFKLFAQDVIALLNHLKITACHLFGFSDGGNTAITLALLAPNRCSKIILNGANLNFSGMKAMVQAQVLLAYTASRFTAWVSRKQKQKSQILDLMVHHPQIRKEELYGISHEVLVLCGSNDMIKTKHSMQIAVCLPNGRLQILPGDHFIAFKEYEAVNIEVRKFLEN